MRRTIMLAFRLNQGAISDLLYQFRIRFIKSEPKKTTEPAPDARPAGVLSTALPNGHVEMHPSRSIAEAEYTSYMFRAGAVFKKK